MTISKVNQLELILFKNDEPQDANPNAVSISFYTTVLIFETSRLTQWPTHLALILDLVGQAWQSTLFSGPVADQKPLENRLLTQSTSTGI